VEAVGERSYRLNVPPGTHDVFHTNLLRPAGTDPFPSQPQDDWQPDPIVADDGEEMYEVEAILAEKGRGKRAKVQVKWRGYAQPTWEQRAELEQTAAMAAWKSSRRAGKAG